MPVIIDSGNIISSLGFSAETNYNNLLAGKIGLKELNDEKISSQPFQTSMINNDNLQAEFSKIADIKSYTKFEKICILSVSKALENSEIDPKSPKTIFILSTTKGNIDLLNENSRFDYQRIYLWKAAEIITRFFGAVNKPVTVSNACISGVSAVILAKRLIDAKKYDNAVIVGADIISRFVVAGFQSFLSLSTKPCRPFDVDRDGLNLGEAAATIVLRKKDNSDNSSCIEVVRGAVNNDANHISGPSRTGEGLYTAISATVDQNNIGFISAHGTATPYNDNMEAAAISRAGLNNVPVNGLKGYFGHTLGAAGILEILISVQALKNNMIIKTMGFKNFGLNENINIADKNINTNLNSFLKLASGFGGCNAAVLIKKHG